MSKDEDEIRAWLTIIENSKHADMGKDQEAIAFFRNLLKMEEGLHSREERKFVDAVMAEQKRSGCPIHVSAKIVRDRFKTALHSIHPAGEAESENAKNFVNLIDEIYNGIDPNGNHKGRA